MDEFKPVKVRFAKNLSQPISIRLDPETLTELRSRAQERGIGPTTLARMWILEHLQELDLHRYRHLADLVQKQCAVRAAALEYALVVVDRTREGPFTVAEQLGLDQCFRKLRQVDRDEALGEIGCEAKLLRQVRNELRSSDGSGSGALPGPRFAK